MIHTSVMGWQHILGQHLQTARRPLIVVLGSTASGKTAFSIMLSQQCGGEVINADSRQLYRGLDIGTAKITPEEMKDVPHHLLNALHPSDPVNIGWYKEQATQCIDAILARKHVPVLVGGSMLYISAVIDGLEPLPAVDPAVRERLSREYDKDAGTSLYIRLQELDPDAAAGIDPRNKVYLLRAVELCETGMPASKQKSIRSCPYDLLIFGIVRSRSELSERIDERVRQMFANGWVDEVRGLLEAGCSVDDPAMQSHGYSEIATSIVSQGFAKTRDDADLRSIIAAKTRQYAKRQMTWWRHDTRIHWLDGATLTPVTIDEAP